MKNDLLNQVRQAKRQGYTDGMWDGLMMGFNITAIALNHIYGFGEDRLKRLETKVQALVDEIVDTNDPIVTEAHIEQAIKQIRRDKYGT